MRRADISSARKDHGGTFTLRRHRTIAQSRRYWDALALIFDHRRSRASPAGRRGRSVLHMQIHQLGRPRRDTDIAGNLFAKATARNLNHDLALTAT